MKTAPIYMTQREILHVHHSIKVNIERLQKRQGRIPLLGDEGMLVELQKLLKKFEL